MNEDKIYVDVNATFTKDGMLLPKSFVWEDGVEYEISKVKDIRRAASLKAGGAGMRYTYVVDGKEVYLFYEDKGICFIPYLGGRTKLMFSSGKARIYPLSTLKK